MNNELTEHDIAKAKIDRLIAGIESSLTEVTKLCEAYGVSASLMEAPQFSAFVKAAAEQIVDERIQHAITAQVQQANAQANANVQSFANQMSQYNNIASQMVGDSYNSVFNGFGMLK